jgi:hypothetical protein
MLHFSIRKSPPPPQSDSPGHLWNYNLLLLHARSSQQLLIDMMVVVTGSNQMKKIHQALIVTIPFHLSLQSQMLSRMVLEAFLQKCAILQATFTLQNPGNLHFLV